jgi:hypothetical protein
MGFVEKFYFTLRHGLVTTYKSSRQRLVATLCYRAIQTTMILNAAVLCAWVVGVPTPPVLTLWNRWSIAVHFALALLGVSAVRDSDAVVENRLRELKAEAAAHDIMMIRKAASAGNPAVYLAARLRGALDGFALASRLLRDSPGFYAAGFNVAAGTDDLKEVSKETSVGERHARVIQLSAAHRKSCSPASEFVISAGPVPDDGPPGEQKAGERMESEQAPGERDSQWIKSLLPTAIDGWWDVRASGDGVGVKFRWRDQSLQSLTFPRVTGVQSKTLKESGPAPASAALGERITDHLRALSLDAAKRDKAMLVAQRLGINLEKS